MLDLKHDNGELEVTGLQGSQGTASVVSKAKARHMVVFRNAVWDDDLRTSNVDTFFQISKKRPRLHGW